MALAMASPFPVPFGIGRSRPCLWRLQRFCLCCYHRRLGFCGAPRCSVSSVMVSPMPGSSLRAAMMTWVEGVCSFGLSNKLRIVSYRLLALSITAFSG